MGLACDLGKIPFHLVIIAPPFFPTTDYVYLREYCYQLFCAF